MKVAISVPDSIFKAADQLAKELKISRSQLFSEAVSEYIGSRGSRAVTRKLDEVYAVEESRLDDVAQRIQNQSVQDETW